MTRLAFLGVFLLTMCVFFPIVGWPLGLFWLALLPIGALVWVLRTQTTVSPHGLDLRSLFSSRHIAWDRVKGVSIPKRGYVRAHLDDDTEVPLPAVSYDRLRDLVDASGGRIPDPFAQPEPADTDADDSGAAAEESAAEVTASGGPRPGTTVSETTVSEDTAPEHAAPEDTAPEGTAPEDTAPEDTAPEDTADGPRARGRRGR